MEHMLSKQEYPEAQIPGRNNRRSLVLFLAVVLLFILAGIGYYLIRGGEEGKLKGKVAILEETVRTLKETETKQNEQIDKLKTEGKSLIEKQLESLNGDIGEAEREKGSYGPSPWQGPFSEITRRQVTKLDRQLQNWRTLQNELTAKKKKIEEAGKKKLSSTSNATPPDKTN